MSSIDLIRQAQKDLLNNPLPADGKQAYEAFLARLEHNPDMLIVGCNDARLPIAQLGPEHGKAIVLRAPAAFLKENPPEDSIEASVVELAVKGKGVKDIIVVGHTDCNAIGCCLRDDKSLPKIRAYLKPMEKTRDQLYKIPVDPAHAARKLEQAAVCATIENLEKYPEVQEALAAGKIRLHGVVIDIHKALAEPRQAFLYELTDRRTKGFSLMANVTEQDKSATKASTGQVL